jgi:hypothetical protein
LPLPLQFPALLRGTGASIYRHLLFILFFTCSIIPARVIIINHAHYAISVQVDPDPDSHSHSGFRSYISNCEGRSLRESTMC